MTDALSRLTEKEKETLRLILRGHDAKSAARHLDLSVHTINERLRDARRKLSVSSSKEAARLLFAYEDAVPDLLGDRQIGAVDPASAVQIPQTHRPPRPRKGVWIMSVALGLLALIAVPQIASSPDSGSAAAAQESAEMPARNWLVLLDQARWEESYAQTASSFRQLNTAKVWADASEKARRPLGAMRSRTLLSEDSVPAPPAGIQVVRFRTSFANRADATEVVSLAREDGQWRVVGVYIE